MTRTSSTSDVRELLAHPAGRWRVGCAEDQLAALSLTHSLWQAGAVDRVRLVMLPVVLGSGRGVFPAGARSSRLRLIGNETLGGLVAVDYAVDSAEHER